MAARTDVSVPGQDTADPMTPHIAHVRKRRRDGPGVVTLEIECTDSNAMTFAAGQFNMLTVFGVGEVPISVSGDPAVQTNLIHTIKAVGPVSSALAALKPGDAIGLRGPFGVGWPLSQADGRDVVVVAGGLGLAPLRPALYRLLDERDRFGQVSLLYGTRSPDDILFRRELEKWSGQLDVDVEVTVDHALPGWHGHVGVVTTLIPHAAFDPDKCVAFVCGPEVMMRYAVSALRDAGLADTAIYLSMERNMKCAVGFCGHCQFGPHFVCRDGPVFPYDRVRGILNRKEI